MIKLFSSDHFFHRSLLGDQPAPLTTLDEMSSAEHFSKRPPTTPTLITSNSLLKNFFNLDFINRAQHSIHVLAAVNRFLILFGSDSNIYRKNYDCHKHDIDALLHLNLPGKPAKLRSRILLKSADAV